MIKFIFTVYINWYISGTLMSSLSLQSFHGLLTLNIPCPKHIWELNTVKNLLFCLIALTRRVCYQLPNRSAQRACCCRSCSATFHPAALSLYRVTKWLHHSVNESLPQVKAIAPSMLFNRVIYISLMPEKIPTPCPQLHPISPWTQWTDSFSLL